MRLFFRLSLIVALLAPVLRAEEAGAVETDP